MAGTVTVTRLPKVSTNGREAEVVQIDWLSDASGNADATVNLHGFLVKGVTDPSASAAPTDNYDITLVQYGVDMAGGVFADRDTANNEIAYGICKNGTDIGSVPPYLAGDHTFTVANAGNAKAGVIYLFLVESL